MRHRCARRGVPRGEDGQLVLLIVFYALIAAAMVLVAVDATIVFLAQRALTGAADAAALAAAQALDEPGLYGVSTANVDLPLPQDDVAAAVADYLTESGVAADYPALHAVTDTDGEVVTVTLVRPVHLPFLAFSTALTNRYPGGNVGVRVTVHSRSPLR